MLTTDPVLEAIRQSVCGYLRLGKGDTVLAAVSGGMDSMAMLDGLARVRRTVAFELCVVHINHGLRAVEADRDEFFVKGESERRGIAFFKKDVDVAAARALTGESIEMAARRLRYDALRDAADAFSGVVAVMTAHHRQDQAETVLERLIRGTGTTGLRGIRAERPLGRHLLQRPLLAVDKAAIASYVASTSTPFLHDSSNLDLAFTRNRIRVGLLPLLQQSFNPQVVDSLSRLTEIAAAEDDYLVAQATAAASGCVRFAGGGATGPQAVRSACVQRAPFAGLPLALQRRVITLVLGYVRPGVSWSFARLETVRRLSDSEVAGTLLRDIGFGLAAVLTPTDVQIAATTEFTSKPDFCIEFAWDQEMLLPGSAFRRLRVTSTVTPPPQVWPASKWETYVSVEHAWTLSWRPWQPGDRIEPLGLSGHSKLVSDVLTNAGVTGPRRQGFPILCARDCVIWVPGCGRSRHALVGEQDQTALHVTASEVVDAH
ncbi:MAG: tRNA lysidine(34) synthetase TilS [Firmicutes bacterium]|nr:tRNA lysidine(34) synthetase TilS [Bacillota bacterium]